MQAKLETGIAEMMNEKLQEKQIVADCNIVKEEKQARYFYAKLKEVRADLEAQKSKNNNPIKEFRKILSRHSSHEGDSSDSDSDI